MEFSKRKLRKILRHKPASGKHVAVQHGAIIIGFLLDARLFCCDAAF
jgi:hypothetical protein